MNKTACLLGLLALLTLAVTHVQSEPASGTYQLVTPSQPTKTGDKIEVLEIFWFGCPHCYHFEPVLNKWRAQLPADVEFRHMPGIFRKNWVPGARAYYTAKVLDVDDKLHEAIFKAIHEEHRKLFTQDSFADVFEANGVSRDDFDKAWNSFTVENEIREAMQMSRQYGISGVPAIIVNGKYRTSASLAGSYEDMLKVVDQLIDTERAASR